MENIDNELQELFAAKRTQEANQRRQEELRKLIEALASAEKPTATKRVRPMWPVWAGAAAAAVALLLVLHPLLQGPAENETPVLVAQTEAPEMVLPQAQPVEPIEPSAPKAPRLPRTPRSTREASPIDKPLPEPSPILEEAPAVEEAPIIEEVIETVAPAPRVIRRQSTLIACTDGCKAPEGTNERSSRNVQVNFFNNDNYADATIHTFVISK